MRFFCARSLEFLFGLSVLITLISIPSYAADYTWTGTVNQYWNNTGNWSGGLPPTDGSANLIFSSSGDYDPNPYNDRGNPLSLRKITFLSTAPAVHLVGYGLSFNMATAGGGIYQNSANTVTIDNPLSWAGSNIFYINSQGAGGLLLTGNITGSGGTMTTGLGSITYSTGTLSTGTNGKLYVGYSGPATLTVQDNATVNVGGELDVNYQATRTRDTSTLALVNGSLTVTGQTIVGRGGMYGGATDYSAKIVQTSGTATFNNLITVGYNGTAKNLYDINGGTANANAGLIVGGSGNGNLNIHGSGSMTVSNGSGLIIGQDSTLATSGAVEQSSGTLSVNGNVTLGNNGGIGTLNRSGGTMTVTGNLITGGTGTLIVDGTGGNISAVFGGLLSRPGSGTLVVIPYTGNLGSTENISFAGATNGTLGPWAVRQTSGSNTSGDYLKITGTGHTLATTDYTNTNFAGSTPSSLVNVTSTTNLTINTSAYAVKHGPYTTTISSGITLYLAGGGMIFNGGTVTGGTVAFSDGSSDKTALIYAGSDNAGTISSLLKTTAGLIKFGPGTFTLSGNSGDQLSGAVLINSGTLNVRNAGALGATGSGNGATVASGAALELQGNISIGNKSLTLNGSGVNSGGALRNVQDNNSYAGTVTLASPTQINSVAGSLTLSGQISGNYNLTKTGTGTLVLTSDNGSTFAGTITVGNGTLTVGHGNALGAYGSSSSTTVNSGATLAIQGGINLPAEPLNVSGTGFNDAGAIRNISGTNSFAAPITLAANSQVGVDAGSLMLSGNIGGGFGLTKTGTGILTLSGTGNNFTGALTVNDGTLIVATVNNSGTNGPLGAGTAPVVLGGSGKTATLLSTGTGISSNRAFTLAANGTGVFQTDNTLTLSGAIGGNGNLNKMGTGTLTLSGTNVYAGTTTVGAGTLAISSSGSINGSSGILINPGALLQVTGGGSGQLPDSGNISLSGGSLNFIGNGSISVGENVGALILNPGQNNITTSNSGGGTPYLRFASGPTSHAIGATVNFNSTNSQIQFLANPPDLTNGILGGYALFNNVDFATRSTTSPYTISAYSSYTSGDLGKLESNGTLNVRPSGTQTAFTVSKQFNSLNLTSNIGVNLNGYTLTLNSGGLIANTTSATNCSGGTLKGSQNGELVVNVVSATYPFTIGSVIANNGSDTALVKTGTGKLTLTGVNTYTGKTFINQGTLEFAQTSNSSYGGEIVGIGTSMTLLKTQSATLTLTGTSTSYSGAINISGGKLQINNSLGNASTLTTINSGGTLGGSGTIGGNATLNSGGAIDMTGGIGGTLTATGGSWIGAGNVTGKTTVNSGMFIIGNATQAGNITATGGLEVANSASIAKGSAGGTITGDFIYSSTATTNYSGIVAGTNKTVTVNNSTSVLTLSGSNTYTGGTNVIAGRLKAGNANALGTGGLYLGGSGTFDLNNTNISVPLLTGSGTITDSTMGADASKLTVNLASGESVFDGVISDNATRKINLEKSGGGSLVFTDAYSVQGNVTVSGGTVTFASLSCNTLTIGAGAKVVLSPRSGVGPLAGGLLQPLAGGDITSIPEPGSITLLCLGFATFCLYGFRRHKSLRRNQ